MILTCPQCSTRYQADAAKFQPTGRNVRCAKCGHQWHQQAPAGESESVIAQPPQPAAPPQAIPRPKAFAPNPVIAREAVAAPPRRPSNWPMRLALGAGWLGLAAIILVVGWVAFSFRQQIATLWPQSASLYAAAGMKANASGIDIQDVTYRRETQGSQSVLAVAGILTNTGARELPVPQMRVTLIDDDRRELYHWTFLPDVTTLHAGQTAKFVTRLPNPPQGARHFELRFAREGE